MLGKVNLISISVLKGLIAVNRTKDFVNLNRFESGRTTKQLNQVTDDRQKRKNKWEK